MEKSRRKYKQKSQVKTTTLVQDPQQKTFHAIYNHSLGLIMADCYNKLQNRDEKSIQYSQKAINIFAQFIDQEFPDHRLHLYGSSQLSLLFSANSDINIAVESISKGEQNILSDVIQRMRQQNFVCTYKGINSYTMDIVVDPLYQSKNSCINFYIFHPVTIKLIFNPYSKHNFNIKASTMMLKFLQNRDHCKIILLLLKKIITEANLLNKAEGGINFYCLFLMFASYVTFFKLQLDKLSFAQIFKKMIKFYAEQFKPLQTVIYFSRVHPCFLPLSEFKLMIDPLKTLVKIEANGQQNTVVTDLILPLYIYDPMQMKILQYGFQKTPKLFQLFNQLNCYLNDLENTVKSCYQNTYRKYNWHSSMIFTPEILEKVTYESYTELIENSQKLYVFGIHGNRQNPSKLK